MTFPAVFVGVTDQTAKRHGLQAIASGGSIAKECKASKETQWRSEQGDPHVPKVEADVALAAALSGSQYESPRLCRGMVTKTANLAQDARFLAPCASNLNMVAFGAAGETA